ncbi:MAG: hypothetical protein G01um101470_86 [Parcubacteria group bacterium Gr01-1014_70]|nr:MAG: hypothetical protein G01um101470_86 [Parcubacteria group bacterium Gr01-1014_70]
MKMLKKILIPILLPFIALANGGDQRLVEGGTYYINLSRAPFTPRVGVKTSFLASFFDVGANRLISEDLVVRVRISKLGDAPKGKFVFEQGNIPVHGGVLELPYIFAESGLHEIFFDFAFASNPEKVYEVPDFLLDIQPVLVESTGGASQLLIGLLIGLTAGITATYFCLPSNGRRMRLL